MNADEAATEKLDSTLNKLRRVHALCFLELMAAFGHFIESMPAVRGEGDMRYFDVHTAFMENPSEEMIPVHAVGRLYWLTLTDSERQDLVDEFWATRDEKAETWVQINRNIGGIETA